VLGDIAAFQALDQLSDHVISLMCLPNRGYVVVLPQRRFMG
jgi:hypothetical protein